MKKRLGVVHVIAECQDCDWSTQDYIRGRAMASQHAKRHKHKVRVEVGMNGFYDGRQN